MKTVTVEIENNTLVFYNSRGTKMIIWKDIYHVWIAPFYKRWQSKKYDLKDIEIIII